MKPISFLPVSRFAAGIALAAAMVAAPAAAQSDDDGPEPLRALTACRDIAEPSARLACFDREIAAFTQAREDNTIAVVAREEVRKTRRALFGLTLPDLKLFDRGGEKEETETFTGTVRAVSALRGGRMTIQIDDTVWQTTETGYYQTTPKVGASAIVTRGILGSYRLSVDGKNGLKAIRLR